MFPLVNKEGMPEVSEKLYARAAHAVLAPGFIEHDVKQTIGKRYARMDEAGTPVLLHDRRRDAGKDQTVTVRDRDTGAAGAHRARPRRRLAGEKLGAARG